MTATKSRCTTKADVNRVKEDELQVSTLYRAFKKNEEKTHIGLKAPGSDNFIILCGGTMDHVCFNPLDYYTHFEEVDGEILVELK